MLADVDNDGMLDQQEFCLAMYLIDCKLAGNDLPSLLPAHLVPPPLPSSEDDNMEERSEEKLEFTD